MEDRMNDDSRHRTIPTRNMNRIHMHKSLWSTGNFSNDILNQFKCPEYCPKNIRWTHYYIDDSKQINCQVWDYSRNILYFSVCRHVIVPSEIQKSLNSLVPFWAYLLSHLLKHVAIAAYHFHKIHVGQILTNAYIFASPWKNCNAIISSKRWNNLFR